MSTSNSERKDGYEGRRIAADSEGDEHIEPVERNIDKVVALANDASQKRTVSAKVGQVITGVFGTMASIMLHGAFIAGWCLYNSGYFPGAKAFDPFPFALLTLIVSFEGVLIALFVLLAQNRMSRQVDLRNHLNLQVSILVEQEVTKVLQLVKQLHESHGLVEDEPAVSKLMQATDIGQMADELERKLPAES